jgi:hypothetical protein
MAAGSSRVQLLRFPSAVERDPAIDAWFESRAGKLGAIARPWYEHASVRRRRARAAPRWPSHRVRRRRRVRIRQCVHETRDCGLFPGRAPCGFHETARGKREKHASRETPAGHRNRRGGTRRADPSRTRASQIPSADGAIACMHANSALVNDVCAAAPRACFNASQCGR